MTDLNTVKALRHDLRAVVRGVSIAFVEDTVRVAFGGKLLSGNRQWIQIGKRALALGLRREGECVVMDHAGFCDLAVYMIGTPFSEWSCPQAPPDAQLSLAGAYVPAPGSHSGGHGHLALDRALKTGRLKRKKGDALCRPRSQFGYLGPIYLASTICKHCRAIAERHGLTIPATVKEAP